MKENLKTLINNIISLFKLIIDSVIEGIKTAWNTSLGKPIIIIVIIIVIAIIIALIINKITKTIKRKKRYK